MVERGLLRRDDGMSLTRELAAAVSPVADAPFGRGLRALL